MMELVVEADGLELEAEKHRTEWCATTSKYGCMKQQHYEDAREVSGPKVDGKRPQPQAKQMGKRALGRARHDKMSGSNGEALVWCSKCSGYARCRLGPTSVNRCRPEKKATKEHEKNVSYSPQVIHECWRMER